MFTVTQRILGFLLLLSALPLLTAQAQSLSSLHDGELVQTQALGAKSADAKSAGAETLQLDDGSAENAIGFNDDTNNDGTSDQSLGSLYFNRFTPPAGDFPLELQDVHIQFGALDENGNVDPGGLSAGDVIDIYVWSDPDGDPATGATLEAALTGQSLGTVDATFQTFDFPSAVRIDGPGDVLIGFVNRTLPSTQTFPATIDETASQGRSWVAAYSDNAGSIAPPENPPVLPADGTDDVFAVVGDLNADLAGNWMIRGSYDTQSSAGEVLSFEKIEGLKGPLDANDIFGSGATGIGDLDNDGVPDAVVGAPRDDDGGSAQDFDAGAVYVLFLNADGSVKREQKISATEGGLSPGTLREGDRFGSSLERVGDFDGDGVSDVVVGATGDKDGGTNSGAVYLLFLNNDGTVKDQQKISDGNGGIPIFTLDDYDYFGSSVAGLGDVDEDGVPDILVGARGGNGSAYVLFLNIDGTARDFQKIADGEGGLASGTLGFGFGNDQFGRSAAAAGDLNGDGVPDVFIGAPGDGDNLGASRGAFYILYLNDEGLVQAQQKIGGGRNGELRFTLDYGDRFGASVERIGDLDGDGVTDLLVGSTGYELSIPYGASYVVFLNSDGTVKGHQRFIGNNVDTTNENGDNFGSSAAALGDLDGDGSPDVIIGASEYTDDKGFSIDPGPVGGFHAGATYVLQLSASGEASFKQKISDFSFGPATSGDVALNVRDFFGSGVAGLGDIDGDGVPDVLVGGGTSYILFLNADGTVDTSQNINLGTVSATGLGDLDGDGVPDALSGGPDISGGQVSILFLNSDGSVKVVQEISRSAGGLLPGTLDSNDEFGSSAARIGDLDGDGITEVVVGDVGDFSDGDTGTAYVLFLNPNGTVKDQLEITDGAGGLATGTLNQRDEFGSSAAGIGDLDADGIPDILIGAAGDDDGGTDAGAVYILFLNADGTVKAQQKISEVEGRLAVGTLQRFEHFGRSASGIGDFDGDGVPDILVGAADRLPGTLRNQTVGAVYALFLDTDGTVRAQQKISATEGGLPSGTLRIGDGFGMSVANIGDLDGNGVPAILAGASGDKIVRPPFEYQYGAAYVLSLDGKPSSTASVTGSGPVGFDALGVSISFASGTSTGRVTVTRFDDGPAGMGGLPANANVSSYRVIITTAEGLSVGPGTEVRFDVSQFGGISTPDDVIVYSRPDVGTGAFTEVSTSYNAESNEIIATTGSFGEFVLASKTNPLPVELARFTATTSGDAVSLTWETASETNNAGFEVERAVGEGAFERIGFEPGAGTTSAPRTYRFTDGDLPFASALRYRLRQVDVDGAFEYSPEVEVALTPTRFALELGGANPFRTATTLRYALPEGGPVTLTVYDVLGRQVATLVDGEKAAGRHTATLDGRRLASGAYFVRLQSGDRVQTRRVMVVR